MLPLVILKEGGGKGEEVEGGRRWKEGGGGRRERVKVGREWNL